ncbi:hypothetical protein LSH36_65g06023 [Paralvinella palmiformis]|uniref:Uncharacterized protein n=1 Tax=Paralvinella palmiformis TaxID=53620 RepID=A0AAD9NDK3_9ANNE|nr:hypothetical protein LSH36_65g06023 [Paralvinella palmiformis]
MYDLLHGLSSLKATHLMTVRGFNYTNIDWSTTTITKASQHTSQIFIDAVRDVFLHQHVTEPTRYWHGQNPNVQDLILTDEENTIKIIEYIPGLGDYIDYVRATQEKNEPTKMTRNLCREFEKDIAKNIKTDPKLSGGTPIQS